MTDALQHLADTPVLVCAPDGPPLADERAATDVIGDAWYQRAAWVAVPVDRLTDDFFRLRTRVAGDIVQKFATYHLKLAVVGDISRHTEASSALRDFVHECNQGTQVWFVPDSEALRARLTGA